ncbi:hypothetical protein B7494_g6268 [Chlorociboria aeruginascens]|nr:hypothetical protein B7494_g6268 [Chlorociboria aeruginascens]
MAKSELSAAKALLLAVQLTAKADIPTLQTLVFQYPKTLRTDILLRILLTYLPESLNSSEYVPFLQRLVFGELVEEPDFPLPKDVFEELNELDANKQARKLHLLPLSWPNAPADAPEDSIVLFLIHRSLRIDENTGMIAQLLNLLTPFLRLSPYLRYWTISRILPLVRFNYEYYPDSASVLTIPAFEKLDNRQGVQLLLSRTGQDETEGSKAAGRDLRGLIGPWMYGDSPWKRRKVQRTSSWDVDVQAIAPLDEKVEGNHKCAGWEEVFTWLSIQATKSWKIAVEVIEQWDGPGDVDIGGLEDGTQWLDEDDQQHLERRYARAALTAAFLISEPTIEALTGVHRILNRIILLLDFDRIPALQAAGAILSPVSGLEGNGILSPTNAAHLRNGLMDEQNILTSPKETSIKFLYALLVSAYLLTKLGQPSNIRRVGELALLQNEREQRHEFMMMMSQIGDKGKGDDRYWTRTRNEILWLRNWGAEEIIENMDVVQGRGIFGQIPKDFLEAEFLKALLANNRYALARSIYETSPEQPLSGDELRSTIISGAMNAYDNATNANRTRGGIKKCDDILKAFPNTLAHTPEYDEMDHLIAVTHAIGEYRLVFKQGEPFTPVNLRVHSDPISILGKVLDQNPRSFTKINDFVTMASDMVKAGLTMRSSDNHNPLTKEELAKQLSIAEKRVISMCIDAALAEDDFETAYSFVVTRLVEVAGPAHTQTAVPESNPKGLVPESPPRVLDDWSWRAALQTGKYRRTSYTTKPTHFGNSSGNLEIRHLEQRMDCLSHALRLAPKSTLQEILNVYRRCEEELAVQIEQEAEQEEAWDAQGDDTVMPGGFAATPAKMGKASSSRGVEESPMSLFDLSRASMARAQSGFSALSMLRGQSDRAPVHSRGEASGSNSGAATPDSMSRSHETIRKRDQLRNAAVNSLASGIGWIINAPSPVAHDDESNEH